MAGGPEIPTPVMLSTWRTPPAPSTAYTETTRNTNKKRQKRTCDFLIVWISSMTEPVEEDDLDTISLGSNTD